MKKGFTLIELLIVISIIGILAVSLIPSLTDAPARARDAGRKAAVNEIVAAAESYYIDIGSYPPGEFCLAPQDCGTVDPGMETFICDYLNNEPYEGVLTDAGTEAATAAVAAGVGTVNCKSTTNTYAEYLSVSQGYEVGILLEATSTPFIVERN